ncbi:hypothetical protein MLD38_009723 [Melastoma candidum]|uniref:Uncharacterized protein n=1 Tax=Melastoma candidum TaxID=119954 RepID=A0ACB9RZ07_9MYRT|nr:hypothetical protein MLD38_009723 [Melastoma candidum]
MHPLRIDARQPLTSSRLTPRPPTAVSTRFRQVQFPCPRPLRPSPSSAGKLCGVVIACSISKDEAPSPTRRVALLTPLLAATAASFLPTARSSRAEEAPAGGPPAASPTFTPVSGPSPPPVTSSDEKLATKDEEAVNWRIYDATAIGEPVVIGKDKRNSVWETVMNARIVYLGEAEQVPTHYDKVLEVEIIKSLRKRCLDGERSLSIAMEAFPSDMQELLNLFVDKRIDGEKLKSLTSHWPPRLWTEHEPLLTYCRDNGVRIVACGTPLKILRTVRAEGIRGLSKAERKTYAPPAGSGFISGFTSISRRSLIDVNATKQSVPFGPWFILICSSEGS